MHAFDLQTVFRLLCESSTASGSLRSRLETRPVSRDADSRAGISLDFADTCLRRTADAMQTSLSIVKLPAPRGGASLAQLKAAVQALAQCHDDV